MSTPNHRPLEEIALSEAARRLRRSWHVTWGLLLKGKLDGRQERGRWLVSVESVQRLTKLLNQQEAA